MGFALTDKYTANVLLLLHVFDASCINILFRRHTVLSVHDLHGAGDVRPFAHKSGEHPYILLTMPLSTRLRYDQKNTIGKTNKLKMVLVMSPPITTTASGFEASEPIPLDRAAGKRPMAAIMAVITTGRSLSATPSFIASPKEVHAVWCLSSVIFDLNLVIRITPFCTHMPKSAIKPIPAEMLKFMPVISNARMPPIIAKGTLLSTSSESLKLPNRMNRIKNIISRLIGTTWLSRLVARCWFSKSPAHCREYPLGSFICSFTLL